jgi:hypothetical protein
MKWAITLSLLIVCIKAYSQFPEPGTFISNSDFEKFVGSWRWINGSDTITIKLKRQMVQPPGKGGLEFVIGYHTYKKGNTIVENSMQFNTQAYNPELPTFLELFYQELEIPF